MGDDDLVFLHALRIPGCRARVDKRFDYHTLQVMTRGAVRLTMDGGAGQELRGRWAWPAPVGRRVAFRALRPGGSWHHRYAAFTGPLASEWQRQGLLPDGPQELEAGLAREVAAALDETIAQVGRLGRWPRLRAANALHRALLLLAEARAAPPAATPAWLAGVLARLGAAEAPDVDLAAEARRAAVGESTLRRQVREATGLPPHAYRLQHKLAAARRLLAETDEPVKAIARRLGYADVYHFARHFKQGVGVPPATFRRSRQV